MMNRKKILFVAESMVVGGVEKSICSLICAIDRQRYQVYLLLMEQKGLFLDAIRNEVTILPEPNIPKIKQCGEKVRLCLSCRSTSSLLKKAKYNSRFYARLLKPLEGHFDVAIGCHNGRTQAYVADKVNADIKIIQNHSNYEDSVRLHWVYPEIDRAIFMKADYITTVSESAKTALLQFFPDMYDKIKVIHNIVDKEDIEKEAVKENPYDNKKGIKIATVCRIGREKGLDLIVPVAGRLCDDGVEFFWYIVGEGDYMEELSRSIEENGLERCLILTGAKRNPYPYMRYCDVYVQPSYSESWGLTVQEALILGRFVVATDIPAFREQIEDGTNGYLTEVTSEGIHSGLRKFIEKKKQADYLKCVLTNRERDTTDMKEEIHKFYRLIEGE